MKKQQEPQQKVRLGTLSNTKLLAGLNLFYMAIICSGSIIQKYKQEIRKIMLESIYIFATISRG